MKKFLAVLLTTVLVVALAVPAFAGPYKDLADNHWAADAVRMLTALGVITGYPDGTFKGTQSANRYEVAAMVARALEYLDKDIAARMTELEARLRKDAPAGSGPVAVVTIPTNPEKQVVLQPSSQPDSTILETIIAEKIAGMTDAQWAEFDSRLSALYARVNDLSDDNLAAHAAVRADIDSIKAALAMRQADGTIPGIEVHTVSVSDPEVKAAIEQTAGQLGGRIAVLEAQMPGISKAMNDAAAKTSTGWEDAVKRLEERVAALEALNMDPKAYDAAISKAAAEEVAKAVAEDKAVVAALSANLDKLGKEHIADLAAREKAVEDLLAVHTLAEERARIDALAALSAENETALAEQQAAITMTFYDALAAERDEREKAMEKLQSAQAGKLTAEIDGLAKSFRGSLDVEKSERDKAVAELAAKFELQLAERTKATLSEVYARLAELAQMCDKFDAAKADQDAAIAELASNVEIALSQQNAELAVTFYDALDAAKEENAAALAKLSEEQDLALSEQNASLMVAFYDALYAEKDEREKAIERLTSDFDLALSEQNASLMLAFYDALYAEKDEREKAIERLTSDFDLALGEQNAYLMCELYDGIWAAKEEVYASIDKLDAKILGVMAAIDALKSEFGRELAALGVRVTALEDQLAGAKTEIAVLSAAVSENEKAIEEVRGQAAAIDTRLVAEEQASIGMKADIETLKALAAQNAKDIADMYYKVESTVSAIEAKDAEQDVEIGKLKQKDLSLDTQIANIWTDLNRVRFTGADEVKFLDIDLKGAPGAVFYKDPYAPSADPNKQYQPTSKLQNELKLALNIKPEKGVDVSVGITAVTDVFGAAHQTVGLFNGDLDLAITTPSSKTKIVAGELARPANYTKYQIGAVKFADAKIEGIGANTTLGGLNATATIAKIADPDLAVGGYQHLMGASASYQATDMLKLGARWFRIVDDPLSGDTTLDKLEDVYGGDFTLRLGDAWTAGGELSVWANKTMATPAAAYKLQTDAKFGILAINGSVEQVAAGYAPKYMETADDEDADYVKADTSVARLSVTTDPIKGVILSAGAVKEGDEGYIAADKTTLTADAKYGLRLAIADVTLKGGVKQVNVVKPTPVSMGTTTSLGFDATIKPANFGFTWEHDVEANDNAYVAYANAEVPVGGDALVLKGSWEQGFGYKDYYKYNAGADMKLALVKDVATFGAGASYGRTYGTSDDDKNYSRMQVGANLDWKLASSTTLTGKASYESRAYDNGVKPSGDYFQYGLALAQSLYKSTTLSIKYDVKDVYYVPATGYRDYGARIVDLSLKTAF
ncbi:MAG: S-layer homology domain-containing protein [Clostridia bacterium]|nr:S-layer homology domain-containing protein [Clostridia bacterium]